MKFTAHLPFTQISPLSLPVLLDECIPHKNGLIHCLWKMYVDLLTILRITNSSHPFNIAHSPQLLQSPLQSRS